MKKKQTKINRKIIWKENQSVMKPLHGRRTKKESLHWISKIPAFSTGWHRNFSTSQRLRTFTLTKWEVLSGQSWMVRKTSSPLAKKWRSSSERKPIHCMKDWQNSFRYLTVIILLPGIRNTCACIKLNTFG